MLLQLKYLRYWNLLEIFGDLYRRTKAKQRDKRWTKIIKIHAILLNARNVRQNFHSLCFLVFLPLNANPDWSVLMVMVETLVPAVDDVVTKVTSSPPDTDSCATWRFTLSCSTWNLFLESLWRSLLILFLLLTWLPLFTLVMTFIIRITPNENDSIGSTESNFCTMTITSVRVIMWIWDFRYVHNGFTNA